jgi:hypothetical protein
MSRAMKDASQFQGGGRAPAGQKDV